MKRINYVLTIIIMILLVAFFWKFFLVVILGLLALLLWIFFSARKSLRVFHHDLQQATQEDIEERNYFPTNDVIDVEYEEKEID